MHQILGIPTGYVYELKDFVLRLLPHCARGRTEVMVPSRYFRTGMLPSYALGSKFTPCSLFLNIPVNFKHELVEELALHFEINRVEYERGLPFANVATT